MSPGKIKENNLAVQRLRQRLIDDWQSLSVQFGPDKRTKENQIPTQKTIRATSLLHAGNSFDHYAFHPRFRAGEWVVFCSVPECVDKAIIWHPFRRGAAIEHFRTHGLELTRDQILDLFGYQSNLTPYSAPRDYFQRLTDLYSNPRCHKGSRDANAASGAPRTEYVLDLNISGAGIYSAGYIKHIAG